MTARDIRYACDMFCKRDILRAIYPLCKCVDNPPDKIRDFATLPYTGRALKNRNVDIITMAPLCKGSCFCLQKLRGCLLRSV